MQKSEVKQCGGDFLCGFLGGALTGPVITGFEVMKVMLQELAIKSREKGFNLTESRKELMRQIKSQSWWRSGLKTSFYSMPQFSTLYGMVCAIEFSVNARIKRQFGELSGLIPSAFTGSLFLTPAEQIMFRAGQPGYNVTKAFLSITKRSYGDLFIGMRSMFVREAVFIFNLFYAGIWVGEMMEKKFSQSSSISEEDQQFWRAIGRLLLGVPLTALTHPFDTASREMQYKFMKDPSCKPSLISVFKETPLRRLFWAGLPPRLLLAPIGGTLATHIYEKERKRLFI